MKGGEPESDSGTGTGCIPTLPPPCPTSPPPYPDLNGTRKFIARIQMLQNQKTSLQEELKFLDGLQPASRCCKDVTDFVTANADPLIAKNRKISKCRRFWKWLCGPFLSCLSCSCNCCCTGCSIHPQNCCSSCQCCKFRDCCRLPKCLCSCNLFSCSSCCSSTDNCCSCPKIRCWNCFKPLKSVVLCSNCCSVSCKCKCSCMKCACLNCSSGFFSCVKNCRNCCCYPCSCIV